nr:hypothetical protein [Tanacetum cinerariifolium]
MHNLFRGGNGTSRTSTLQLVEGKSKGGDDACNGIDKSGGVLNCDVFNRGLASSGGDGMGNGGDSIWGSGDDNGESGNSGGVGITLIGSYKIYILGVANGGWTIIKGMRTTVFSGHTYVPDPEHPPTSEFVPEPVYPEFMTPEDDVLPTEEQPLPAADSPTVDSLGYILESDPGEDPEEDDKDPKEDPTNYPTDRDDDNDEDKEDFSRDEAGDEEEDEDDKKKEHPALADSVLLTVHRVMARMFV